MIDQGCQTKAQIADMFVTALGEILRNSELLDCSSIDINSLALRHNISIENTKGKKWNSLVQKEFKRLREEELTKDELEFVEKVILFKMQSKKPEDIEFMEN